MTTVTCIEPTIVLVKNNGRAVRVPIANFVAIDGGLHDCAARAQANPGIEVLVPAKSFARGIRPRNYGLCGIQQ